MKKLIRLTESDLHRIINKTVYSVLKEGYHDTVSDEDDEKDDFFDPDGNPPKFKVSGEKKNKNRKLPFEMEGKIYEAHGESESYEGLIYGSIIEDYKAQEIAEEEGISEEEAAVEWFKNVAEPYGFEEGTIPKWREYVTDIPELDCSMYHDYGAGYYFLVKDSEQSQQSMPMESVVRRAVRESIKRLVETDCAGVMQTGCGNAPKGTNPEAGQYTVPLGADKETSDRTPGFSVKGKAKWNKNPGNVQRREIYNPKSGKKKLGENSEINQFEESPLWVNKHNNYEKDILHKRKIYYYLCKIYDEIMNNLQSIGLEPSVAYKALMPLQDEIKSHEQY